MAADAFPGISVVIPTYGRAALVGRLLQSLSVAAGHYSGPVEVLVIDDSRQPAAGEIEGYCSAQGATYLRGMASVREKRNLGTERSQYPIVLFVDSDCEAASNLYEEHARFYRDPEPGLGGVVGITEFVGPDSFMWEVIKRTQYLNAFSFAQRMEYAPWATCSNTSYRRDVLIQLGGFDTHFPFKLGADDVDLGLRVNKAGYRLRCNPASVVTHARETWNSFGEVWQRAYRWGRMDVHLYYRKYPERVVVGTPKFSQTLLLLTVVLLMEAIIFTTPWLLVMPILWAGLVFLLQAAFTARIAGESWRFVPHELVADVLGFAFEFGTLVEALKCREWSGIYKTVSRGPVLPAFKQQEWVVQAWCSLLSLLVLLIVQGYLLR